MIDRVDECNFLSLKFDFFRSLEVFHFASSPRQSPSSSPFAFSVFRTAFKPVDLVQSVAEFLIGGSRPRIMGLKSAELFFSFLEFGAENLD
jgi:hypothetical protein